MSDLISRQAAIDAANRADYRGLTVEDVKKVTDEVVKEIKKLPPAPEIIRCGKCAHKDKKIDYCRHLGITICECDYCSYAVRRTDELGNS